MNVESATYSTAPDRPPVNLPLRENAGVDLPVMIAPLMSFARRLASIQRPLAVMLVWMGVGCVALVQVAVRMLMAHRADLVLPYAVAELSILPFWALATPWMLLAGRKLRQEGDLSAARIMPLLLSGSLFVVLANVIIRIPLLSRGLPSFAGDLALGLVTFYPAAMVVYGVIVSMGFALAGTTAKIETTGESRPVELHLTVAERARTYRIAMDDLEWIEAEDNYVLLHTATRSYTLRRPIAELESGLDAGRFVRVHRSAIVNVEKVAEVRSLTHGDFLVVLRRGTEIRGARTRRPRLEKMMGKTASSLKA